ncbi:MAG: hypothetical protein JRF02_09850 [Deltaproteobacteria bacterium]|jgi:hypothetical protein|nr:hypothetical protein [Deltaproteobacteria bacterium]
MGNKTGERDSGRFQRISKARIFDGHPLKLSIQAVLVLVSSYTAITSIISILFSYFYRAEYSLVYWTLLPGAFLGLVLLVLERFLGKLKSYLFPQFGKLLTAFLLFFIHLIGYLALSSIVVNYPVGFIIEKTSGLAGVASEYSLFSGNFFIVIGLLSWLRNVRAAPYRCF